MAAQSLEMAPAGRWHIFCSGEGAVPFGRTLKVLLPASHFSPLGRQTLTSIVRVSYPCGALPGNSLTLTAAVMRHAGSGSGSGRSLGRKRRRPCRRLRRQAQQTDDGKD